MNATAGYPNSIIKAGLIRIHAEIDRELSAISEAGPQDFAFMRWSASKMKSSIRPMVPAGLDVDAANIQLNETLETLAGLQSAVEDLTQSSGAAATDRTMSALASIRDYQRLLAELVAEGVAG